MNRYIAAIDIYLDNGDKLKFTYKKQDNIQACDVMFFDDRDFVVIKASNSNDKMINKSKIVNISVFYYEDDSQ